MAPDASHSFGNSFEKDERDEGGEMSEDDEIAGLKSFKLFVSFH